jgi:hypothetical protein
MESFTKSFENNLVMTTFCWHLNGKVLGIPNADSQ